MATRTIPTGCYRQPTESSALADGGTTTFAVVVKGLYTPLETWAKTLSRGDELKEGDTALGLFVLTWQLDRAPGDTGVLTINCLPSSSFTPQGGTASAKCLDDLWEVRSVRNDMSIFSYCGDTNVEPSRAQLEAWMKEPDGELAAAFQYRDSNRQIVQLAEPTLAVAKKIAQGREAVVRFFAAVTRTRTYDNPPECLENLSEINAPQFDSQPATPTRKPSNLQARLDQYEWLKMQDDAIEQSNGQWKRIESWWGIPKSDAEDEHPWDPDFYGSNRWTMPYGGSSSQSS